MYHFFQINKYPIYIKKLYWLVASFLLFSRKGIKKTSNIECIGLPIIDIANNSQIKIGSKVTLCSVSRWTALGVSHPVILRTLLPGASIEIGDDTGISGTTICAARTVRIGKRCLIGADVLITDTDFHPITVEGRRYKGPADAISKPVVIEDDVFIGARSVILKGVKIGAGAIVGAGSVVTSDISERSIVAGNPARFIKLIN